MINPNKAPLDEETSQLLNSNTSSQTHGSTASGIFQHEPLSDELKSSISNKLYISHFLYVWNTRIYEFGIVLFIINLYPNTLLPSSLFAFCSAGSGILLTSHLTRLVNNGKRLNVIKRTITLQRSFAILSASSLLIVFQFFKHHDILKLCCLVIVIFCGIVEKLATIANKMSISRDWIVKICHNDDDFLLHLNTKLRSIDLFCKLVGPFFISTFLSLTNHEITAIFFILSFLISNQIEFQAILKIYESVPFLKETSDEIKTKKDKFQHLPFWETLKIFTKTPLAPAIISLSLIYFTVLSFGNATVAYLLSFDDINNFSIGVLKGASTVFELFGTIVIFPFLSKRINLINTGLVAILLQFLSLLPIALAFVANYEKTHWLMCILIPFSRVGLWCFDLAVQNSIQIHISDDFLRFNATTFEESLNNLFELLGYGSTLIFNKPSQFKYPVFATVFFIFVSVVLYSVFWIRVKTKRVILE